MHDRMTVAHEIKYPWRCNPRRPQHMNETDFCYEFDQGYRESFVTIWHVDPGLHGSDDSCGWFTPPFSEETLEICKSLAFDEARAPWFFATMAKANTDPILCERLLFGAFVMVSRCLANRRVLRKPVSVDEAMRWAAEGTYNSVDNFRGALCFLSGYHSNSYHDGELNTEEEDRFFREEQAKSFFGSIAGWIFRDRRPWYRHPRWHLWHWKFQVHPLQLLHRWIFDRCNKCGGRFDYGETPIGEWSGKRIWHTRCDESSKPAMV